MLAPITYDAALYPQLRAGYAYYKRKHGPSGESGIVLDLEAQNVLTPVDSAARSALGLSALYDATFEAEERDRRQFERDSAQNPDVEPRFTDFTEQRELLTRIFRDVGGMALNAYPEEERQAEGSLAKRLQSELQRF